MGVNELSSFLHGTLLGWSWLTVSLDPDTQTRSSSESFLREALEQTNNLIVYKSTLAKKIIIRNGAANAVLVNSGGIAYNISARNEVILSAGVVCTSVSDKTILRG